MPISSQGQNEISGKVQRLSKAEKIRMGIYQPK
nr:MAG TPA: hypothetical protein [Bacteriophage sp.]